MTQLCYNTLQQFCSDLVSLLSEFICTKWRK